MKTSQPKREWKAALEKCHAEEGCRVCGRFETECAHTVGRKYDQPLNGSKTLYVDPDAVVPLCSEHHRAYDPNPRPNGEAQLNLLPYLTEAEQTKAVELMGGIEIARQRLTGEWS